jgi:hypothetical protein
MGGGYKKEMSSEKGGVHRRAWEVAFKQGSCHVMESSGEDWKLTGTES